MGTCPPVLSEEPPLGRPALPGPRPGWRLAPSSPPCSLSQLNVVSGVSLSEDVKPLAGLPGLGTMNYPSASPGPLVKHICAICGDRSSGTGAVVDAWGQGGGEGRWLSRTHWPGGWAADLDGGAGGEGGCSGSSKATAQQARAQLRPQPVVLGRPARLLLPLVGAGALRAEPLGAERR